MEEEEAEELDGGGVCEWLKRKCGERVVKI